MKREFLALVFALTAAQVAAVTLEQTTLKNGTVDIPVQVAVPSGKGPFPPVLFIHAKRGIDDNERRHIMELAGQGFLVVMPDWQAGRMIERWPSEHDPATEGDVEAAFDYLLRHPQACRMPAGIVAQSRGPCYAIRLAAKRGKDIAAIASYYGHMQNPNAPEPDQLFRVAPEIMQITTPLLLLIGEQDFEVRRMSNGRAFYALWERGVPVELQGYPLARRAFDFRADQTPEEKVAARHARQRTQQWLQRWMKLDEGKRCR
ncbi:MAG: dienelactone hydrolase family protein [Hylemonella sp.]|nr:dienelactone hydrolase family protein [Hylemonella sp.]